MEDYPVSNSSDVNKDNITQLYYEISNKCNKVQQIIKLIKDRNLQDYTTDVTNDLMNCIAKCINDPYDDVPQYYTKNRINNLIKIVDQFTRKYSSNNECQNNITEIKDIVQQISVKFDKFV